MNSVEIEERKAQILTEIDAEGADLNALETEMRSLNTQLEELRNAEVKREEIRAAAMTAPATKTFEEEIPMSEVRTFAVDSTEYRDAYMKNLMGLGMSAEERTALTSAASVIPTQTVDKIYGLLEKNPLIAKLNALHIPGYVSVPKATTVNDASWVGIGTAATDSADVVGSVALSAKKLIKTVEITADIKAMSIPAFETWLTSKLAAKMEKAICAAVITGGGTTTVPQGLSKAVTALSTVTSVSIANLGVMMGTVGSAYHQGAIWIMSSSMFYTKVLPLAQDSNGVVVTDGIAQRIFGHEVVIDDNAGSDIYFGNLGEGYVFNFGEGIAIESDQSVAFRSGSTVYRAMALCDGAVVDADAFARATIA